MAQKDKDLRQKPDKSKPKADITPRGDTEAFSRDEELCAKQELQESLRKLYADAEKALEGQSDRTNDILDYWDIYNCLLGPKQFYAGNSKIFLPIVTNAINARKVRFTNQIFPSTQRNVDCISEDGQNPNSIIAMMEHYIRKNRLKTTLIPALLKNGDVEGQYTVYVSWQENKRDVVYKELKPIEVEIAEDELLTDPDEKVVDIVEEEVTHRGPKVEIIADADFAVFPATVDSIEEALDSGGGGVILRRWSKAKCLQMVEDGELDEKATKALIETSGDKASQVQKRDTAKSFADAAGIKKDARGTYVIVYEVWAKLTYKGKKRIYRCYFGGPNAFLSCKRNPYWSDKLPIISCPVDKQAGLFKGKSKLSFGVADMQIMANDAVNEGMDSAAYALLPIIMTDPEKNPRVGSMIMDLAAFWETNPNDTQFAKFPELWRDAFEIIAATKAEIFQALSISPANIPQAAGKKKLNQAEIAQEQQIDILTTADAVSVLEEGILTPMLQRWLELDHQYRDDATLVRQYGDLGANVHMERIEPVQMHRRWELIWFGVEAARAAAQIQLQISAMNVLRGIPPQFYKGYEINLVEPIKMLLENIFGARVAPRVFVDMRRQLSKPAKLENMKMLAGEFVEVSQFDNHQEHMAEHQRAAQEMGDPHRTIEVHNMLHQAMLQQQMLQQQQAQQAQQPKPPGSPGAPGGAGPGMPGQGGAPMGPNAMMQRPNGAIPQDQMAAAGSPGMPRRMG